MHQHQMLRIVFGYALVGCLYILFSDSVLHLIAPDLSAIKSVSIAKGLGFVLITALTLWWLLKRIRLQEGERYQALVEGHRAIMLLIDPGDGRILDANKAAADFYGYSLEQLRALNLSVLNHLDASAVHSNLRRALRNEQTLFHLPHWLANGEQRDVVVRTGPVSHLGRTLLLSIMQDETAEKRNQLELERSNRLLGMLSMANQAMVKAPDRSALFEQLCNIAVDAGAFRMAWIGMIDPDGNLVPQARAGEDQGFIDSIKATLGDTSLRGIGPTGMALRKGEPGISNDFLGDPHTIAWHAAAAKAGIRSVAAYPIRSGEEIIGSFNLYSEEAGFFGAREQETLTTVIDDLSYGLRYLDNQQALKATADVVEASPAVLFRWRNAPDWPVMFVTDNVSRWGYSAASLMSGRIVFNQLIHPDDRLRVEEEVTDHVAQRVAHYEQVYRVITQDQNIRWVDDHTTVSYDAAGVPQFFQGLLTDITERKAAESTISDYIARLERAFVGTALAVSQLVELRDPYTAGHERRVGELAAAIAAELGYDQHMQQGLQVAGALHDVGKVMVPVEILAKPTRLTESETRLIRLHPGEGYKVLKGVEFPWPVAEVAYQHHERMDGSGYPQGLKGEAICLEARIIAVADVVESMSSDRPYRPGRGVDLALQEIERGIGIHYDSEVVTACLRLFREKGYHLNQQDPRQTTSSPA